MKTEKVVNPEEEYLHIIGRETGLRKLSSHIDQLQTKTKQI